MATEQILPDFVVAITILASKQRLMPLIDLLLLTAKAQRTQRKIYVLLKTTLVK
jgi:hypothetical protein